MKKSLFFAVLLTVCAVCTSCASRRSELCDLVSSDYTATLSYAYGGTAFTAEYTHVSGEKILTFLSPESLCGVTAKKAADGRVTLSLGDVSFDAEASDGFFYPTVLFDLPKTAAGEGKYVLQNERDHATLLCEDGLPCRIYGEVDGRAYDVTVTDFTLISPERSADK